MSYTTWVHNIPKIMLKVHACFYFIFSLSGSKISDNGASVLGEMLKVNKSLKELK